MVKSIFVTEVLIIRLVFVLIVDNPIKQFVTWLSKHFIYKWGGLIHTILYGGD